MTKEESFSYRSGMAMMKEIKVESDEVKIPATVIQQKKPQEPIQYSLFDWMKQLIVNVGTDYPMTSPSHPYSSAVAAKRMVDRIVATQDTKFEVNVNSESAVKVLEVYGHKNGLTIKYCINGKRAKYKEVLADFARGEEYYQQLKKELDEIWADLEKQPFGT